MEETKDFHIGLVQEIYRLTLLFPKKEPLRYKMRELADEILEKTSQIADSQGARGNRENFALAISQIDTLDSFFEIAKMQNWARASELLNVQEKYSRMKDGLKRREIQIRADLAFQDETQEEKGEREADKNGTLSFAGENLETLKQRQQKILDILKEKEKTQVWEVKKVFPKITKRTLRRDFEQLLKQGLIERIGERNATFYRLKEFNSIGIIKI